jgi:hypothetical protein
MAVLKWDETGERTFETGVSKGVLYPQAVDGTYPLGVVWNGLTAITESPSGGEATPLYADNRVYLNLMSAEKFAATIESFTFPKEFESCDGTVAIATGISIGQQTRKTFGMVYVTVYGNDLELNDYGYKIHIIYGGLASPSEKGYNTVNETAATTTFSWEVSTTPVDVPGFKPTASVTIDSTTIVAAKLKLIEDALFGTESTPAHLLLPSELMALMAAA